MPRETRSRLPPPPLLPPPPPPLLIPMPLLHRGIANFFLAAEEDALRESRDRASEIRSLARSRARVSARSDERQDDEGSFVVWD